MMRYTVENPTVVGLRVDVDTLRGTRDGVPALLDSLRATGTHASFFFSVGPDNMGRHVRRLARPRYLWKMLRSNAASLYGWDILLRGTLWPGPRIAQRCPDVIRRTADEGHEVGLHAWDHHAWQARLDRMSNAEIRRQLELGFECLKSILGTPPTCSATAGWKCDERVLREKQRLGFRYNSDCRGRSIFIPVIGHEPFAPQVPANLPTYDEMIGRDGVTDANYNALILDLLRGGGLKVLTIHAEVEGIARHALWCDFLAAARDAEVDFVPLSALIDSASELPSAGIERSEVAGRDGWICVQGATIRE